MKILVLLLSLLFSVSGLGNKWDPFKGLRATTQPGKICTLYDGNAQWKDEDKKCVIPELRLKLSNREANPNQVCYYMFDGEYKNAHCHISKEKLLSSRSECLSRGKYCPKEMKLSLGDKGCKEQKEHMCGESKYYKANWLLYDTFLGALYDYNKENPTVASSCETPKKISKAYYDEKMRVAEQCLSFLEQSKQLCSLRFQGSISTSYGDLLYDADVISKKYSDGSKKCNEKIKAFNPVSRKAITTVMTKLRDNNNLKGVVEQNQLDTFITERNTDINLIASIEPLATVNKTDKEAFTHVPLQKTYQKNKGHVRDTFNKLDQKMADRLNKGKATKENRKPNNVIASVNNEASLPNKKKNNKYLVASSNNSFLTKKDIFKTVSNAYYKMCQTDSCYGIVKK